MPHQQTSPTATRPQGRGLSWAEDPFAVDPDVTLQVLEHFFQDVNNATYGIFPRHHFLHWVRACPEKSRDEKLLLYAMLAIGSRFAEDTHAAFGKQCAHVAADALRNTQGQYSIAVVQGRLLLGLYHYAKGANETAWELIAAGVSAALYLQYNTEDGCSRHDMNGRSDFGLSTEQLIECKRRTLWSAFMMDRYCGSRCTLINPKDIFLRLPCLDDSFERGVQSEAPHYDNGIIDPAMANVTPASPISPMGWLCLMAALWGEVVDFVYRAPHRSSVTYQDAYERFYAQKSAVLQNWLSRLPEQLRLSRDNVERSIKGGLFRAVCFDASPVPPLLGQDESICQTCSNCWLRYTEHSRDSASLARVVASDEHAPGREMGHGRERRAHCVIFIHDTVCGLRDSGGHRCGGCGWSRPAAEVDARSHQLRPRVVTRARTILGQRTGPGQGVREAILSDSQRIEASLHGTQRVLVGARVGSSLVAGKGILGRGRLHIWRGR